jgi:ABC-2 family transporter protein
MIWLTWRQFRVQAAAMAAALAGLALILALTGAGLADDYSSGIAACTAESGGCSAFVQHFFQDHQNAFLAVTAVVLILPALIGLFWGAPLIARELEAGTHRLVWNQSITRTRWLAVKLGLTALAVVVAAGLGSLAVDWWSNPIDKAAAGDQFSRMEPLLFDARGIVPIGYALFAFALGVTVGMLVRRTVPAMAVTLGVFVAVQIAMPLLVRAHLIPPTRATVVISGFNLDQFSRGPDGRIHLEGEAPDPNAWLLSSQTVDASGRAVDSIPLPTSSGPCAPRQRQPAQAPAGGGPGDELSDCFAEIKRLGYRQQVTYQPSSRFWAFQAIETGIFSFLALALAGFCFWRIRHRVA